MATRSFPGLAAVIGNRGAARRGRLAGEAATARAPGCKVGPGAAEAVLQAGLLKPGGGVAVEALSADRCRETSSQWEATYRNRHNQTEAARTATARI